MDKIEKIRQEIERLKKYAEESKKEWINEGYTQNAFAEDCRITSFDGLLSFIDTLSKEPICLDDGGAPNSQKCGDCTIACDAKVEEDRDVVFWKGMQHAIAEMKEDAVEGIYTKSMDGKNVFVESGALKIDPASVKVGDPVHIIVLPKED